MRAYKVTFTLLSIGFTFVMLLFAYHLEELKFEGEMVNKAGLLRALSLKIKIHHHKFLDEGAGNVESKRSLDRQIDSFLANFNDVTKGALSAGIEDLYKSTIILTYVENIKNLKECSDFKDCLNIKLADAETVVLPALNDQVSMLEVRFVKRSRNNLSIVGTAYVCVLLLLLATYFYIIKPRYLKSRSFENQQAKLLDEMPIGFILVGPDRKIAQINKKLIDIFGFSREELVGEEVEALVPDYIKNAYSEFVERYFRDFEDGGSGDCLRLSVPKKDGVVIDIEVMVLAIENGVICLLDDVTEKNKLIRENDISSSMSELGVLSSGIAHELKNPLTTLGIGMRVLEKKVNEPELLDRCKISIKRITDLISSISSYSKSCSTNAVKEKASLKSIANLAKSLTIFETKNICSVEIEGDDKEIILHEGKVTQVLINLIVNATHSFNKENIKNNVIKINIRDEEDSLVLKVSDNGSGIPKNIQHKIFDTFFTTKSKQKGTGLGLSLVKEIIEDHGGEINLNSIEGEGTTFTIVFPDSSNESAQAS